VDAFWLTTERLALRRFGAADRDWLASLYSDVEVTRYLGGTQDSAAVNDLLEQRILRYYDEHPGLGIWMTVERRNGAPIGLHTLNHIRGERDIQVGFVLARHAWGNGFAREMAAALLRYGFEQVGLRRIVGITALDNVASQQVLRRIGLRRNGDRSFAAYAAIGPQAWFERDADDWTHDSAFLA